MFVAPSVFFLFSKGCVCSMWRPFQIEGLSSCHMRVHNLQSLSSQKGNVYISLIETAGSYRGSIS